MKHSTFWFPPYPPTVHLGSTGINCTFTPKAGWSGSDAHSCERHANASDDSSDWPSALGQFVIGGFAFLWEQRLSSLRRWSGACFLPYVPVVEVVLHVCLDIYVSCMWLLTHFGNTFIKFPCWRSPVSWWDVFWIERFQVPILLYYSINLSF